MARIISRSGYNQRVRIDDNYKLKTTNIWDAKVYAKLCKALDDDDYENVGNIMALSKAVNIEDGSKPTRTKVGVADVFTLTGPNGDVNTTDSQETVDILQKNGWKVTGFAHEDIYA